MKLSGNFEDGNVGDYKMMFIVGIGFYTIWFTPIIFISSLFEAIKAIHEGRDSTSHKVACCISFMLIVIPMFLMLLKS